MENNYISTVLSKIKDDKIKEDIQAELEDHYNERVEYYTLIGYDKETAETKANEHFGDEAEIIGEQLDSINTKSFAAIVVFTFISALFFWGVLLCSIGWSMFDVSFSSSFVGNVLLLLFLPICLADIAVGLRNKSAFLSAMGFIGIVELTIIFKGFSSIIFCIYKLISGDGGRLLDLLLNYDWQSTSIVIKVLGILFPAFCIGLHIYAVWLINLFRLCKYRKRHIRQEKNLKITAVVTAVLLLFLLVIICVTPAKNSGKYISLSGIYVIESDEMIDPADVEDYDQNFLEIDWDYDNGLLKETVDSFVDSNLFNAYINDLDDDADVVYNTYIMYGEFQPTKKYVCVVPIVGIGYKEDFDKAVWYDTSKETLIVSDNYNTNGSIVQYKVKILPREAK
ncbi:MAG: hypothetical protein J1E05_00610 [Eubacterium sp.]|nr:hypothetical protein [Eubacterium sp.]